MKRVPIILTIGLVLSAPAGVWGGLVKCWGSSGLTAVAVEAVPSTYTGWDLQNGTNYYFRNGKLVAGYVDGIYRTYTHGVGWSEPTTPPWKDAKIKSTPKAVDCTKGFLFGVQADRLQKDGDNHYSLTGRPVTRETALNAIQLADDSAKPYITFIGEGGAQLATVFLNTPIAQKCRVHSYAADAWEVTGGFKTDGKPTVYVQNPKGEVLARLDHPTVETVTAEARHAQPDYDASKDPTGGSADALAFVKKVPTWAWIVGGAFVLILLKRNSA